MVEAYPSLPMGLLPERRVNWGSVSSSFVLQALLLLFVVYAGLINPENIIVPTRHLVYTPLVTGPREYVAARPQVRPRLLPPAPVTARLVVPLEIVREAKATRVAVEAPNMSFPSASPALVKPGGALPRPVVQTGMFAGSSATPTINRPTQKVQTGGFGDPNGLPGQGNGQGRLIAAKLGSFDLPEGAGNGNGSGGVQGARGTVASAGFGSGVASPGHGDGRSNGRGVQQSGFGDAAAQAAPTAHNRSVPTAAATTPVEIISKPKPVYSEEARQLRLEGEVLVEAQFGATGEIHVQRVVKGLGHGLDEAAVAAANKIRFKPAMQNGQPVDSTAVVHVVFELAY
jgi:TonB family protein